MVQTTALGIAVESPQRSEDLERKARPAGQRPNEYNQLQPNTFTYEYSWPAKGYC